LFNKILIATDGSDKAKCALHLAKEVAKKWNAELLILSVVPTISPLLVTTAGFEREKYMNELKKVHEKVLVEAENTVTRTDPEIKVITKLGEGRSSNVILKVSEKENVDLIVIGSRGHGPIRGWILGSTSKDVVENSKKPLLIIK
jgi:nucleotide-binding universal stress UspA family protein